jgi:hypothetical protein
MPKVDARHPATSFGTGAFDYNFCFHLQENIRMFRLKFMIPSSGNLSNLHFTKLLKIYSFKFENFPEDGSKNCSRNTQKLPIDGMSSHFVGL